MAGMGTGVKAAIGAAVVGLGAIGLGVFIDQAETQETAPTPRATIAPVDWAAAEKDGAEVGKPARPQESTAVGALTGGNAASFELQMPLLLPTSLVEAGRLNQLDQPLNLIAEEFQYSAEAKAAPRSYLIQGTRYVFEVDSINFDEEAVVDPGSVAVEALEYGVEASFQKYGVTYSVTIFCDDPAGDPECASEETVRRLASEMQLVN